MAEKWKCPNCGGINPGNRDSCVGCNTLKTAGPVKKESCPNCGTEIIYYTNFCQSCGTRIRSYRLEKDETEIQIQNNGAINCLVVQRSKSAVYASLDLDSERLYVLGHNDILPISSEEGDFLCVHLPGGEKGYVHKETGIEVEFGLFDEFMVPLGYARHNIKPSNAVSITSIQSDGSQKEIGKLKKEDHLPIVEESADVYRVQLKNGMRGWIQKAYVIRTISSTTELEAPKSTLLSDIAFGAAALIGLGVVTGIEEDRVRRTVDRELRSRGY